MPKITEKEQLQMKGRLITFINKYLDVELSGDHKIGYIPEDIDTLMTNAAFAVLLAINATNNYFEDQGMLK